MNKFIRWGATFSVNMACYGNKGVLSIPIYSYIDNKQKITIEKIDIDKNNNINLHFNYFPVSSGANTFSNHKLVNGSDEEGYRENYNERYD